MCLFNYLFTFVLKESYKAKIGFGLGMQTVIAL